MEDTSSTTLDAPIPFITLGTKDNPYEFVVSKEACDYLSSITGPVSIVSIAGLYRTGKSYLLNLLLGRVQSSKGDDDTTTTTSQMFGVGGTVNAYTKGIWIWGQPITSSDNNNQEENDENTPTVLFLDTEGLGSTERSTTQDTRLFALALLLSSVFLYNSRGVIDANAIQDLSLVVHLSKFIQLQATNNNEEENNNNTAALSQYFPVFKWIVRDFTLSLESGGKKITSKEYLESALLPTAVDSEDDVERNEIRSLLRTFFPNRDCITLVRPLNDEEALQKLPSQPYDSLKPEFRKSVESLMNSIGDNVKHHPKKLLSKTLSGSMLLTLANSYVDAFNSGNTPVISTAWDRVMETKCEELLQTALKYASYVENTTIYGPYLRNNTPISLRKVFELYDTVFSSSKEILYGDAELDPSMLAPYRTELFETVESKRLECLMQNEKLSEKVCQEGIERIYNAVMTNTKDEEEDFQENNPTEMLEAKLNAYATGLTTVISQYRSEMDMNSPCAESVLSAFLIEKLTNGIVDWGTFVVKTFNNLSSDLSRELSETTQAINKVKGKSNAIQEILRRQKETYEKELVAAKERSAEVCQALSADVDAKDAEIRRTMDQIEKEEELHQDNLKRIDVQITEARQKMENLMNLAEEERSRREGDVKTADEELRATNRHFYTEEKNLIEKQQETLLKVVELERALGAKTTEQLEDILSREKEAATSMHNLKAIYEQKQEVLKEKIKSDLKALKASENQEIVMLSDKLNEKKAQFNLMQEKLRMASSRKNPASASSNTVQQKSQKSFKTTTSGISKKKMTSKADCTLQ